MKITPALKYAQWNEPTNSLNKLQKLLYQGLSFLNLIMKTSYIYLEYKEHLLDIKVFQQICGPITSI